MKSDIFVTAGDTPYVIAEIGVNHEGDFDTAKRLIDLAADGGANAAKFQTYKADTIAAKNSPSYWDTSKEPTTSQHALFSKFDAFGPDEYAALAAHCEARAIAFCSTPFDADAVAFLDPLVPFFKIASADITNVPLLRQIAATGKPVILSTGASDLHEIATALDVLDAGGAGDVVLLQCTLNYPCPPENAHIRMIGGLARTFPGHLMGFSDHTPPDAGMLTLTAAWLAGAMVLEKHFTHDKTLPGNDHYHAMDVDDLKRFRANVAHLLPTLGDVHKHALASEAPAREHARRSIVTARALKAGETITADAVIPKRPAHGISPLHWDAVVGLRAARDLPDDHILQWPDLKPGA